MITDFNCNQYALLKAHTGITSIQNANPFLDGMGSISSVITAGESGTLIRSVIIKAAPEDIYNVRSFASPNQGMVRLFIGDGKINALYKEVPIPQYPSIRSVSLPFPVLQTFEVELVGNLMVKSGYSIFASTEFAFPFNIFAEGLTWTYPRTIPKVCCNFKQETAITGIGSVTDNNIVSVFTSDNIGNGSTVRSITIKALGSTHEGSINIFMSSDSGITYYLFSQIYVPQTVQSGFEPSFKKVVEMNFNLQAGYTIGIATQNSEDFAITVEGTTWSYAV